MKNVEVIKGAEDDPKLPSNQLDAALIVNAYHEMTAHEAMLRHTLAALNPEILSAAFREPEREARPRWHTAMIVRERAAHTADRTCEGRWKSHDVRPLCCARNRPPP